MLCFALLLLVCVADLSQVGDACKGLYSRPWRTQPTPSGNEADVNIETPLEYMQRMPRNNF